LETGQIITIIAYDIEGQAFQFAGKIGAIEGDKLILSQVFNSAIEAPNTPFIESGPPASGQIANYVIDQFSAYRLMGLEVPEAGEKINQDIKYLNEKL